VVGSMCVSGSKCVVGNKCVVGLMRDWEHACGWVDVGFLECG
jgi:hypothetical protein